MNPGRFVTPNLSFQFNPLMRSGYIPNAGGMGLFGRIASSIKRFNWSGLLNGANKTLNVVNQTIPLVRQAGPMVSNMKNMFKIAKAFGNETTRTNKKNSSFNNVSRQESTVDKDNLGVQKKEAIDSNYPNFFV